MPNQQEIMAQFAELMVELQGRYSPEEVGRIMATEIILSNLIAVICSKSEDGLASETFAETSSSASYHHLVEGDAAAREFNATMHRVNALARLILPN